MLKYIKKEKRHFNNISHYYCFYTIFDQIIASLESIRDFKTFKNPDGSVLSTVYIMGILIINTIRIFINILINFVYEKYVYIYYWFTNVLLLNTLYGHLKYKFYQLLLRFNVKSATPKLQKYQQFI